MLAMFSSSFVCVFPSDAFFTTENFIVEDERTMRLLEPLLSMWGEKKKGRKVKLVELHTAVHTKKGTKPREPGSSGIPEFVDPMSKHRLDEYSKIILEKHKENEENTEIDENGSKSLQDDFEVWKGIDLKRYLWQLRNDHKVFLDMMGIKDFDGDRNDLKRAILDSGKSPIINMIPQNLAMCFPWINHKISTSFCGKFVKKELASPGSNSSWLSIHLVVYNEELAIPEQMATDKDGELKMSKLSKIKINT
ncbi:hypothetical protein Tco_0607736 [Tanacetum coccineum]